MISLDQIIVWVIVGVLGGSLTGLLVKRERKGFGMLPNLGLGLAGALVGGVLFRLLGLFPDLDKISISPHQDDDEPAAADPHAHDIDVSSPGRV